MTFSNEALKALYGAYRLARLDPRGLSYFNLSEQGFWRSFKAAGIVFPMYFLLMAIRYGVDDIDTSLGRYMSVELIAFVIGWVAFPVAMVGIARQFERTRHYMRYIIAYNWAAVLQNGLYIPIAILSVTGQLTGAGGFLVLLAMVMIIFYTWYVAKTALEISGPAAAGVVAFDFVISFAINMYAQGLL